MKNIILTLLIFAISHSALAVDLNGINLNGEASFDYTFLSSKQNTIPAIGAATNEAYRLNQVQIVAAKEAAEISFIGRILFAPTVYVAQTTPSEVKSVSNFGPLDQMEIYYKVTPQLSVGFGRLYTTMGFESFLRSENPTYGNSIASQTIVPLNGEGLRAKYVSGEWLTATLSSYNQTAYYSNLGNTATPTKTTEVSATGIIDKFGWFASYHWGTDPATATTSKIEKSASSIWGSYKFSENFTAAVTYDAKGFQPTGDHNHWADAAGVVITYGFGVNNLAVRYELVRGAMELSDIATGRTYGNADSVKSLTITDKIAVSDNLKLYFEYRMDQADEAVFPDENGEAKKDVSLATIGAVAHF